MGSRRVSELTFFLSESPLSSGSRESEIVELKSQLARMREDWIEEECHRVEAQLALKEARKEIKQLKQVIETMRSSLADKDKAFRNILWTSTFRTRSWSRSSRAWRWRTAAC